MNIHHLKYFVALAKRSNFGEAAKYCHVSQPAISMAIRSFEEKLGEKLFIRQTNPVQLSPYGELILPYAERIIYEYSSMMKIGENVNLMKGNLRVGIIPTVAPYLLPKFIGNFTESFPEISLDIEEVITENLVSKIQYNELDVGILATPVEGMKLEKDVLYYEEFMAYSASNQDKKYILPEDLDLTKLWILKEGHCFRNQIINLCELKSANDSQLNYHAGSIETLMSLVDNYGGITVIPELASRGFSTNRKQKLQLFKAPAPVREISLVYHKFTINENIIKAFSNSIKDKIPKHMKEKEAYLNVKID